jgi:hypothetical protein
MDQPFARYITKRTDLDRWPLQVEGVDDVDGVIVVPCLAERPRLPAMLSSLAQCSTDVLRRTLIICVVNNRSPDHAEPDDIRDNQALISDFKASLEGRENESISRGTAKALRLGFIDASSPGNELPKKDGVGLARKIGLDCGLSILAKSTAPVRLLYSLDADTTVAPNYLDAIHEAFDHDRAWAGVVHFEHPLPDDSANRQAIVDYEIFLRCHVHGLRVAESAYAFHTVGSTMVCTPEAYVAVSGMNRRQAGEDFYFLQQLAKTGEISTIASTKVHPSARASHRVPFGTGRRVRQALANADQSADIYNPAAYSSVQQCLELVHAERPEIREETVQTFLRDQKFDAAWTRICEGATTDRQRERQFHTWFDAFRTLKLIHFLRDNGYPNVAWDTAADAWSPEKNLYGDEPEKFLMWLREQDCHAAADSPMGLQ